MANPLCPKPYPPAQNFAVLQAPGQTGPEHPSRCREVEPDKQLPTVTGHHGSLTANPKDLMAHKITTEKTTAYSSHPKSHAKTNDDQQSPGLSSQPVRTPKSLAKDTTKTTSDSAAKDRFKRPANPNYSSLPRQASVSSQQGSYSSSGRTENNRSRTSLAISGQTNPGRTGILLREPTIRETMTSGHEPLTRSRSFDSASVKKLEQELKQRVSQRRSAWQAAREVSREESFSDIAQPVKIPQPVKIAKPVKIAEPVKIAKPSLKEKPGLLGERLSTPALTSTFRSGNYSFERQDTQHRPDQSTSGELQTPAKIVERLESLVDQCIEYSTIDVRKSLKQLQRALASVHNKLSWEVKSQWDAALALDNSQKKLGILAGKYHVEKLGSLTKPEIREFEARVKECVEEFIEAVKKVKTDHGKNVELESGIPALSVDST